MNNKFKNKSVLNNNKDNNKFYIKCKFNNNSNNYNLIKINNNLIKQMKYNYSIK